MGLNKFTLLYIEMATYPVIHKETGEQKEVKMSITEWTQWCEDNPDWKRDWSDPSTMPGTGEVGDWQDKLRKKAPGWNSILKKAQKAAPRNPTIKQL